VYDFGLGEENNTVAVCVAVGKMDGADVLAIEVDSGAVVEGDDGERFLGAGGVVTSAATEPSFSRLRTFSCAMIGTSVPNWTLPPAADVRMPSRMHIPISPRG